MHQQRFLFLIVILILTFVTPLAALDLPDLDDAVLTELASLDDDAWGGDDATLDQLADPLPLVTKATGEPTLDSTPLTTGSDVPWSAQVTVPEESTLELIWPDGPTVTIEEATVFTVQDNSIILDSGGVTVDFPGSAKGFSIVTPAGTASCVGTLFFTQYLPGVGKLGKMNLKVYGGIVKFTQDSTTKMIEAGRQLVGSPGAFETLPIATEVMQRFNPIYAAIPAAPAVIPSTLAPGVSTAPAPAPAPAPVSGRPVLTPAGGTQGGLMNFGGSDTATEPVDTTGSGNAISKPIAAGPGNLIIDGQFFELLNVSNVLSEAIGILNRIEQRAKQLEGKTPVLMIKTKLPEIFQQLIIRQLLAARAGIRNRLIKEELMPPRSRRISALLEKYDANGGKSRTSWLLKRIQEHFQKSLPEALKKADAALAALRQGRNPLAAFRLFKSIINKAYSAAKAQNRKTASKYLASARKIRDLKVLNIGDRPLGIAREELTAINKRLEMLRSEFGYGKMVPPGWGEDGEDLVALKCRKRMQTLLSTLNIGRLTKAHGGKLEVGSVDEKSLLTAQDKDTSQKLLPLTGKKENLWVCPAGQKYQVTVEPTRHKGLTLACTCPLHGKVTQGVSEGLDDKICQRQVQNLAAAVRSYLRKDYDPKQPIDIDRLIKYGHLKEAPSCPKKGKYSIERMMQIMTFPAPPPSWSVSCSAHKHRETVTQDNARDCNATRENIRKAAYRYLTERKNPTHEDLSVARLIKYGYLKEDDASCPLQGDFKITVQELMIRKTLVAVPLPAARYSVTVNCSRHKSLIPVPLPVPGPDSPSTGKCHTNCKIIWGAARSYMNENTDVDQGISIDRLMKYGYLKTAPNCPEKGGRYTIHVRGCQSCRLKGLKPHWHDEGFSVSCSKHGQGYPPIPVLLKK